MHWPMILDVATGVLLAKVIFYVLQKTILK